MSASRAYVTEPGRVPSDRCTNCGQSKECRSAPGICAPWHAEPERSPSPVEERGCRWTEATSGSPTPAPDRRWFRAKVKRTRATPPIHGWTLALWFGHRAVALSVDTARLPRSDDSAPVQP